MTLIERVSLLSAAIRDKFNSINQKLVPAGGSSGQILRKGSASDHDMVWASMPVVIGSSQPQPANGESVLWVNTTGGNVTMNIVTGG